MSIVDGRKPDHGAAAAARSACGVRPRAPHRRPIAAARSASSTRGRGLTVFQALRERLTESAERMLYHGYTAARP